MNSGYNIIIRFHGFGIVTTALLCVACYKAGKIVERSSQKNTTL